MIVISVFHVIFITQLKENPELFYRFAYLLFCYKITFPAGCCSFFGFFFCLFVVVVFFFVVFFFMVTCNFHMCILNKLVTMPGRGGSVVFLL